MLEDKSVQWALNRLEKWADINLMKFNKGKCKILHLAWNNPIQYYRLGDGRVENNWGTWGSCGLQGEHELRLCSVSKGSNQHAGLY